MDEIYRKAIRKAIEHIKYLSSGGRTNTTERLIDSLEILLDDTVSKEMIEESKKINFFINSESPETAARIYSKAHNVPYSKAIKEIKRRQMY